jgi:hypothetical protein
VTELMKMSSKDTPEEAMLSAMDFCRASRYAAMLAR